MISNIITTWIAQHVLPQATSSGIIATQTVFFFVIIGFIVLITRNLVLDKREKLSCIEGVTIFVLTLCEPIVGGAIIYLWLKTKDVPVSKTVGKIALVSLIINGVIYIVLLGLAFILFSDMG